MYISVRAKKEEGRQSSLHSCRPRISKQKRTVTSHVSANSEALFVSVMTALLLRAEKYGLPPRAGAVNRTASQQHD